MAAGDKTPASETDQDDPPMGALDEAGWQDLQAQLREAMGGEALGDDEGSWQDIGDGALFGVLECCESGNMEDLVELLEQHSEMDLNMPGPDGDTALHIACLYGHLECVQLLLEKGADASVVNAEDGSTTLHDAAAGGYLEICQVILERAKQLVNTADEDGDTPLHNAARGNHAEVVTLLLKAGAEIKTLNKEGKSPMQEAEEEDVIQILKAVD